MADSSPKSKTRSKRELAMSDELYDLLLEGVADLLSVRHASSEVGRELRERWEELCDSLPGSTGGAVMRSLRSADVRDLAFDLAEVNVNAFKDLSQVGRKYSEEFWKRVKDARLDRGKAAGGGVAPAVLQLKKKADDKYAATFKITNALGRHAALVLPSVLVLQKSDGSDRCFASPEFAPSKSRLDPDQTLELEIRVDAKFLHGKQGTFLAETSVTLGSGDPLALYIELEV
jgi:hypothetical protein